MNSPFSSWRCLSCAETSSQTHLNIQNNQLTETGPMNKSDKPLRFWKSFWSKIALPAFSSGCFHFLASWWLVGQENHNGTEGDQRKKGRQNHATKTQKQSKTYNPQLGLRSSFFSNNLWSCVHSSSLSLTSEKVKSWNAAASFSPFKLTRKLGRFPISADSMPLPFGGGRGPAGPFPVLLAPGMGGTLLPPLPRPLPFGGGGPFPLPFCLTGAAGLKSEVLPASACADTSDVTGVIRMESASSSAGPSLIGSAVTVESSSFSTQLDGSLHWLSMDGCRSGVGVGSREFIGLTATAKASRLPQDPGVYSY